MKKVPCPQCGKDSVFSAENPYRPFCSERCQMIDLGKWANEEYAVPGEQADIEREDDETEESSAKRLLH